MTRPSGLLASVLALATAIVVGLLLLGGESPESQAPSESQQDRLPAIRALSSASAGLVAGEVRIIGSDEPGADLRVRVEACGEIATGRTDAAGRFSLRIRAGEDRRLIIEAPGICEPLVICGLSVKGGAITSVGTLYLGKPVRARGVVVDPRGAPVPGALVRVHRSTRTEPGRALLLRYRDLGSKCSPIQTVTSDGEGAFVSQPLIPGVYSLEARARGFASGFSDETLVVPRTSDPSIRIVLRDGAALSGTVTAVQGEPLEGVRVTVVSTPSQDVCPRAERRVCVGTDREGRFVFPCLAPGEVEVVATLDNHPQQTALAMVGRDQDIHFVFSGTATLAGNVREDSGNPIEGAEVTVLGPGQGELGRAITDNMGSYRIEHLSPGRLGGLFVQKSGFVPVVRMRQNARALRARMTLQEDITLSRGAVVGGRVTSAEDGQPIAGAEVRLVDRQMHVILGVTHCTLTDDDGNYNLRAIGPGKYRVAARAPGFCGTELENRLEVAPDAHDGTDEPRRDLILRPAGRIQGRVVTPDGQPVPLARIVAVSENQAMRNPFNFPNKIWNADVVSDAHGRFSCPEFERRQPVRLKAMASGWVAGLSERLTCQGGGDAEDILIRLRSPGSIEGVARGADGSPIRGALVRAIGEIEDVLFSVEIALGHADCVPTDEAGRFRIEGLQPGPSILRVEAADHIQTTIKGIDVPEGACVSDLEVTLERGLVIAGEVKDEAGIGVNRAFFQVLPPGSSDPATRLFSESKLVAYFWSGKGGLFRFGGLPPGEYVLEVSKDGYLTEQVAEIRAGTSGLSVLLVRSMAISGTVLLPDGAPASGCCVTASGGAGRESAETDLEGHFVVESLRPGVYRLTTWSPDSSVQGATLESISAGATGLEIQLESAK
jgi:Carboxypeptidase regulatory-like domain